MRRIYFGIHSIYFEIIKSGINNVTALKMNNSKITYQNFIISHDLMGYNIIHTLIWQESY